MGSNNTESEICKFYDGQNVLITGGTGFMGKILIEKLLRSTNVANIYLLIREKKGKNVHTRLDDIFDNCVFGRLKNECPKFRHRVVALPGDCSITGLGLTINDREKLMSNVNIVFHVAATVRFDENLKLAYSINVKGTHDVVELCRQIKNLKALVHVSTAYSNCYLDKIGEQFYDYPVNYEDVGTLLEKLSKNEADKLTPRIIDQWPNTYTFTKALGEALIRANGAGLPIAIYRPAMVISTYNEPFPGWIDNLYGPTGACAGAASGLLHVMPAQEDGIADLVPVDTCVAGLIAAAWDIQSKNKSDNIPIYNCVSSVENPLTWGEFNVLNTIWAKKYPLTNTVWTIRIHTISNMKLYFIMRLFLHFIPAFVMDAIALLGGHKPRLLKMYNKIHKFSDVITFFSVREWHFENVNVQDLWKRMNVADKEQFPMSVKHVLWVQYFRSYMKGIRVYLLHDPIDNLEAAKKRLARFEVLHRVLKFFLLFVGMGVLWSWSWWIFGVGGGVVKSEGVKNYTGCEFLT